MPWTIHRTALLRMLEEHLNGGTVPDPARFYLILTNGVAINDQSTIATVAGAELAAANGYTRMSYNPNAGTYDATQTRYEMPPVTVSITATGAGLQYDTIVLLSNANPTVREAIGNIEFFQIVGATTVPAGAQQSFVVSFNLAGNGVDAAAA